MDVADIANTDRLRLSHYYATPQEWRAFLSGAFARWPLLTLLGWAGQLRSVHRCRRVLTVRAPLHPGPPPAGELPEEEQALLADKLAAALIADERHREKQAAVAAAVRWLLLGLGGGRAGLAPAGWGGGAACGCGLSGQQSLLTPRLSRPSDPPHTDAARIAATLTPAAPACTHPCPTHSQIDADPDYDLAASLGSRPALRGSPRPRPPSAQDIAAELEASKAAVVQQYGLVRRQAGRAAAGWQALASPACASRAAAAAVPGPACALHNQPPPHPTHIPPQSDEDWEAAKAATVAQQLAAARRAAAPPLPNHVAHGRRLFALLDSALPRDHHGYEVARQQLSVLEGNPGWSQERKMVYAKRLLKRLAATPAA